MISLWNFIKFLGMIAIILMLIGIIFALFDAIYSNIQESIIKRKLIKEINKQADMDNIKIEKIAELSKDDK